MKTYGDVEKRNVSFKRSWRAGMRLNGRTLVCKALGSVSIATNNQIKMKG